MSDSLVQEKDVPEEAKEEEKGFDDKITRIETSLRQYMQNVSNALEYSWKNAIPIPHATDEKSMAGTSIHI